MGKMSSVGTIIFCFMFFLMFSNLSVDKALAGSSEINCLAHDGKCTLSLGKETVTLEIIPRPVTAMRDSTFIVTLSGKQPEHPPYIDLGMPAMKMGPNKVKLKHVNKGTYKGQGIIVRCQSGHRKWFANVIVPGVDEVKFIFDVVY